MISRLKLIQFPHFKISVYLFGVLSGFNTVQVISQGVALWEKGSQNIIQLVKVLYCQLLAIDKERLTFTHNVQGLNHRPLRWEVSMLPLFHHGLFSVQPISIP